MTFTYDPLVGIGIFYVAIMSQTFNRTRSVKWLTVEQHLIDKLNQYTVNEYIPIIFEHLYTNFMSPAIFNCYTEWCSQVKIWTSTDVSPINVR